MTDEQIDQIFTSLVNTLEDLPVNAALTALAGVTGNVLSSLPSNIVEQASEQYITMIKEVTAIAKKLADTPTLH